MLSLVTAQILAACALVFALGAIFLGSATRGRSTPPGRVIASESPGRWTEVLWMGGTVVSVFWPLGVLVVPTYAYHWPPFPAFIASTTLQIAGLCLALFGGLLFYASTRALGRYMTPAIQAREDHPLVQTGPYRYVRHPAYTAILATAWGLGLLFWSPVLGVVASALTGVAIHQARLEEQLLGSPAVFGARYAEYVARTGRFLPRIRP